MDDIEEAERLRKRTAGADGMCTTGQKTWHGILWDVVYSDAPGCSDPIAYFNYGTDDALYDAHLRNNAPRWLRELRAAREVRVLLRDVSRSTACLWKYEDERDCGECAACRLRSALARFDALSGSVRRGQ